MEINKDHPLAQTLNRTYNDRSMVEKALCYCAQTNNIEFLKKMLKNKKTRNIILNEINTSFYHTMIHSALDKAETLNNQDFINVITSDAEVMGVYRRQGACLAPIKRRRRRFID